MDCAPHFEKMLYDNPQLARVYLHAWQVTGNDFFRTVTEGSAHGFESKNILEFVGDMDQHLPTPSVLCRTEAVNIPSLSHPSGR